MPSHGGHDAPSGPGRAEVLPDTSGREAVSVNGEPPRLVRSPLLAAAGVRHGFSTRLGGVSRAYWRDGQGIADGRSGELNLGFAPSDSREHVLANRAQLLHEAFGRELPLVTLQQVHSTIIHCVTRKDAGAEATLSGDGLLTGEAGPALGIQTADCVPVLVADRQSGAVGAFHAGWRGTLGRIVEQGVARMCEELGAKPENLLAAVGPAIGPCCYGIGGEVEQQFRDAFHYADELLHLIPAGIAEPTAQNSMPAGQKLHLDLPAANRRQLLHAGLGADAVDLLPWCTRCRNDLFFSYRAERGVTGRMLAVIAGRHATAGA